MFQKKVKNINKNFYRGRVGLCLFLLLVLVGCAETQSSENSSVDSKEEVQAMSEDNNMPEHNNILEVTIPDDRESLHEEEWYRTDVASYQWARIIISDYKEGESFQVTLDAIYFPYSGTIEGTATFIEPNRAVLYDENVESFLQQNAGDHGIYFQFLEDSIIVTHDNDVRLWFGGGGVATAEGTYIQGEPQYTNCTDVREIFTENELSQIQELLEDNYIVLFEEVIELGEVEEYAWDGGRFWKAYRPHVGAEWCNIIIYDDGRIYIEGNSFNSEANGFYTNSGDIEMPDVGR